MAQNSAEGANTSFCVLLCLPVFWQGCWLACEEGVRLDLSGVCERGDINTQYDTANYCFSCWCFMIFCIKLKYCIQEYMNYFEK